jgi:hypothetical protein
MKRRPRIWLLLLIGLLLSGFPYLTLRQKEPTYQGKTMTA